jgi:hypothetical protein
MGLPLSPAIANFFTEDFEEVALNMAVHLPVPLRGWHIRDLASWARRAE